MTEPADAYSLRPLTDLDIEALHVLTVEAGWPHRPDDWRFVLGLGSGIAVCDQAGRIVGCAMWWPFGEDDASLGMVLVTNRLQGLGLGRRLMAEILAAADGRRIMLNATEAGRPLYERLGFRRLGTIRQHQGLATVPAGEGSSPHVAVRPFAEADGPMVAALDLAATGRDRGTLLAALARHGVGVVAEAWGRMSGFAFTRPFGRGHVAGPIVAPDEETAIALLRPALAAHAGTFLRTDTPVADGRYSRFLEAAGLVEVDTALIMARNGTPQPAGPARIYGLASQALG